MTLTQMVSCCVLRPNSFFMCDNSFTNVSLFLCPSLSPFSAPVGRSACFSWPRTRTDSPHRTQSGSVSGWRRRPLISDTGTATSKASDTQCSVWATLSMRDTTTRWEISVRLMIILLCHMLYNQLKTFHNCSSAAGNITCSSSNSRWEQMWTSGCGCWAACGSWPEERATVTWWEAVTAASRPTSRPGRGSSWTGYRPWPRGRRRAAAGTVKLEAPARIRKKMDTWWRSRRSSSRRRRRRRQRHRKSAPR